MSTFRAVKIILAATTAVFMVAALYVSVLVSERQRALGHILHYNVTWSATKSVEELARLEEAILGYAISPTNDGKEEIDLRLAILESRVQTNQAGDFRFFTAQDPERETIIKNFSDAVEALKPVLGDIDSPQSISRARAILDPIKTQLASLVGMAHDYSGKGMVEDREALVRLHWLFSAAAAGLIGCGLALIALLFANNALLRRAHSEASALADHLRNTATELEAANAQVLAANAEFAHIARHDPLTELPNRVLLRERLEQALLETERYGGFAVLCLDLDHFKTVNDTLGHLVGDALLEAAANRLRSCVADTDTVARLGGDEFAILQVGNQQQPGDAVFLAKRIAQIVSEPYEIAGHTVVIGISIGIAIAPNDGRNAEELLAHADTALYRAKTLTRGTFCLFKPDMHTQLQARRSLEVDLRRALDGDKFELAYQPIFDVQSGQVTTVEALLRWTHPERGRISPAEFIPIAEEIGLIVPIGEWVLHQACAEASRWAAPVRLAVNLSAVQLRRGGVANSVINALSGSGLPPHRLELEVTESVFLGDSQGTVDTLHQLKHLGVSISMDDFGTGYSSLSYLRKYPIDKIKIDRSFVTPLGSGPESLAMVRAIVDLAGALGLTTVAEGVETEHQLALLRQAGCKQAQGFYLGRPVPDRQISDHLRDVNVRSAA